MMINIYLLFLLLAGSVWPDIRPWQVGDEVPLRDLGETAFYHISDFKIDGDRIYIADIASNKVYMFDSEGHLINSSGRDGRGPGEFTMGPKQIVPVGETVYVTGRMEPYFFVYDSELNFLKNEEIPVNLITSTFLQKRNGQIYIIALATWEDTVVIYDPVDGSIEGINLNFEIAPGHLYRHNLYKTGDRWLFAWYYQNKFKVYDSNFNEQLRFSIPGIQDQAEGMYLDDPVGPIANATPRQREVSEAGTFASRGSFFEGFVVLDEEHFMVQLGQQTGGRENALILNPEGDIVQEITLPGAGKILGYSDRVLYIQNSEESHVVAYEFYRES